MLPTITPKPEPARFRGHEQRFGKAAAFVELDVHDLEAADEAGHVCQSEDAFIGGDRDWALEALQIRFASASQRLLDQRDILARHGLSERGQDLNVEALIGIDTEPDVGPRLPHGANPLHVELEASGQLDLDSTRSSIGTCAFRHLRRFVRSQRKRRNQRARRLDSCEAVSRGPRPVRFKFPESAIDRVASAADRQDLAKLFPAGAGLNLRAACFQLLDDSRCIVAKVINAARFATSAIACHQQSSTTTRSEASNT